MSFAIQQDGTIEGPDRILWPEREGLRLEWRRENDSDWWGLPPPPYPESLGYRRVERDVASLATWCERLDAPS